MILLPSNPATRAFLRHLLGRRSLFDAVAEGRLQIRHHYRLQLFGPDGRQYEECESSNIVPAEGIEANLFTLERGGTQYAQKYVLLFKNNYTPVSGDTMALFPGAGVANEASEYTQATRPLWNIVDPVAGVVTNAASPAVFTFNGTINVYGAALSTNNTKGGTGGKLMSATRFSGTLPKVPNSGDTGNVTVQQTMTSV